MSFPTSREIAVEPKTSTPFESSPTSVKFCP